MSPINTGDIPLIEVCLTVCYYLCCTNPLCVNSLVPRPSNFTPCFLKGQTGGMGMSLMCVCEYLCSKSA